MVNHRGGGRGGARGRATTSTSSAASNTTTTRPTTRSTTRTSSTTTTTTPTTTSRARGGTRGSSRGGSSRGGSVARGRGRQVVVVASPPRARGGRGGRGRGARGGRGGSHVNQSTVREILRRRGIMVPRGSYEEDEDDDEDEDYSPGEDEDVIDDDDDDESSSEESSTGDDDSDDSDDDDTDLIAQFREEEEDEEFSSEGDEEEEELEHEEEEDEEPVGYPPQPRLLYPYSFINQLLASIPNQRFRGVAIPPEFARDLRYHQQGTTFGGAPAEVLESYTIVSKVQNASQEKPCPICLDVMTKGIVIRTLPCFHIYHKRCIDKWYKESRSCPVCKHVLDS